MNPMKNNKAMALVEIVVSMLVLAVAALAVTSTISMVNSSQMRSAGGSSLDLQAASYARETLDTLKNAVSTDLNTSTNPPTGRAAPLYDNSYTSPCNVAEGQLCGPGTSYTQALPSSDLLNKGGTRTYKVWDISSGTGLTGTDVAYKKVTATVTWND